MSAPRLQVLQSLWGFERLRGAPRELTVSERLRRSHAAGFDGISAHFHDAGAVSSWIDEAQDLGLVIEGCAFPASVEDLRPALELAARHRIHHVVVQGLVRPYDAAEAAPILRGWQALADAHGVPLRIETHRHTLTNDLWVTRELLDRVPEVTLLADLSHYVCGQEITLPVTPEHEAMIRRILSRSGAFHGRVASSGQIQLEIGWAEAHAPWTALFLRWWEDGFVDWLGRAAPGESLTFTCELGPAPYAITGADGQDRSDRWTDARHLREQVLDCWRRAVQRHAAGAL